ncbi:MAG: helix-turn-helix domain-containing protein [Magnetovibrio sp.]|nr:helix-turn-helix domain-containing protein [Magnetovibrio sp.]
MENLYNHIELNERCEIYRLHADGISRRRIVAYLDRSPSTIGPELKRNTLGEKSVYKPAIADHMAMARQTAKF